MTCADCGAEGADCLTADRVRVCSDCLYDRVVKERDEALRERDEARAEVDGLRLQIERLRGVLHIVSLDEYESTSSAAEKIHAHARQARVVLNETLAVITPSDAAHVASLENLFLKACKRAEKWETASKDAYRRGAEAMREACAVAGQEACRNYIACGEVVAETLRALPVPEEEETTDEA